MKYDIRDLNFKYGISKMTSPFFTKLKVGITTLFAIIILFGGVLWVKNYNPAKRKLFLTVEFVDGKGITGGDIIQMSGIKVGEVTRVSLSENNTALVKFYMNYTKLSPDCIFTIKDVGLMGDKALVIIPGTESGEIDRDVIQKGSESTDLGDLIANADKILQKLDSISGKIDNNIDIAKLSNDFGETLDKFNEAIAAYKDLANETKNPLNRSLKNLEASSTGLKNFIEKNDNKLEQTIESLQNTSEKISLFIDEIQNLSTVVDTLAVYMKSDGTFSRLIRYDDLYEELRHTNANIDSFITDFKRNPGKYTKDMKFKLRLF